MAMIISQQINDHAGLTPRLKPGVQQREGQAKIACPYSCLYFVLNAFKAFVVTWPSKIRQQCQITVNKKSIILTGIFD